MYSCCPIEDVNSVAYSPDGSTIASGTRRGVRLWDTVTGEEKVTLTMHGYEIWSVAYSPDGSTIAGGGYDDTVRLWDAVTGKEKAILTGHTRLWDAVTSEEKLMFKRHMRVNSVAYSPGW